MKQGTLITKIIMFILFGAVVAYVGFYALQLLICPLRTTLIYEYTADESATAMGFVVRDEQTIASQYDIVDIVREEGERVGKGQTIATAYRNEEALSRKLEIRALELRLEQLKYSATSSEEVVDAVKLDSDIINSLLNVKTALAEDNMAGVEEDVLELKNLIFKRDYAYNKEDNLDLLIAELGVRLTQLRMEASYDTTEITASQSGIYSGLIDGYENVLTVELLDTITPSGFDEISSRKQENGSFGVLGKLIWGHTWRFVTAISSVDAAKLKENHYATVRFSKDIHEDLRMKVERIGQADGDRCVVVFSLDKYLSMTTLLRRQTVDIIYHQYSGLRVPQKAVRVDEEGQSGVYCLVGLQAEFKAIAIVYERDDYYLVKPAANSEGLPIDGAMMLREGDEVIVAASDLYDGKVVQ